VLLLFECVHGMMRSVQYCAFVLLYLQAYELFIFSSCLAAIVHDYEHNGVNNDFLIRTSHPRAMVYNDRACQEQHHIAAAFACLEQENNNVLKNFSAETKRAVRKIMIELVLGTDMSQHNGTLSQFRIKLNSGGW
jgi:hypothetical protein